MSARPDPPLYELGAARSDEQLRRMQHLEDEGICTFCPGNVGEPIEHSGEHWYVVRNKWPYRGTLAHWLIVPHRHVRSFDELPDAAGAELWAIKRLLREREGAAATATVERSGDMRLNGGSVAHLHTHFVVLGEGPEATVKFRVSAHADGR